MSEARYLILQTSYLNKYTIMKKISFLLLFAFVCMLSAAYSADGPSVYKVKKLKGSIKIDANWDKAQWKKVKEIPIVNFMGQLPAFQPVVTAKMMYDSENLYLIYKVEDRHVRIQNTKFNSSVSTRYSLNIAEHWM